MTINASETLCELAKNSLIFEVLSKPGTMDKISLGLESENHTVIRSTIRLLNAIMREYTSNGTNKHINISNFTEDEAKSNGTDLSASDEKLQMFALQSARSDEKSDELRNSDSFNRSKEEANNLKEKEFLGNITSLFPIIAGFLKAEADNQEEI